MGVHPNRLNTPPMPLRSVSLPEKYRDVLVAVQFNARASVKEIARRTKYSESTVRYVLDRLRGEELLTPCLHVNAYALGYTDYGVYIARGSESKTAQLECIKRLSAQPGVFWLTRLGAMRNYGITYFARSVHDLDSFLTSLTPRDPAVFFEKSVVMRLRWTIYPARHLLSRPIRTSSLTCDSNIGRFTIDQTDHRVLQTLSEFPGEEVRYTAKRLGMPLSTVSYRIDRLVKNGIILGFTYLLDTAALGLQSVRLHIIERSVTPESRQAMIDFCGAQPNVVSLGHCIGCWDYEIRLDVPNLSVVDQFCEQLTARFRSQIRSIELLHQYEILKWNTYPFPTHADPIQLR